MTDARDGIFSWIAHDRNKLVGSPSQVLGSAAQARPAAAAGAVLLRPKWRTHALLPYRRKGDTAALVA